MILWKTISMYNSLIEKTVGFIEKMTVEKLQEDLPDEYYYSCLPLCLIDAVFSIGACYTSTKNVVLYFAQKENIHVDRRTGNSDYNIDSLLRSYDEFNGMDYNVIATDLFNNRQRTSSENGITKAEAVKRCAVILKKHDIQTIETFQKKLTLEIEEEIKSIPGQHSGISLAYLKMLCGFDNNIKPDRHIMQFLGLNCNQKDSIKQAQKVIEETVNRIKIKYPYMTERKVDYLIWYYMKTGSM